MKERPILFSPGMVRAILDGRKTQTRRVAKLTDSGRVALGGYNWHLGDPDAVKACPYGQPGDRLYVKEACWIWGRWTRNGLTKTRRQKWRFRSTGDHRVIYAKPGTTTKRSAPEGCDGTTGWVYRHARFMPRWASRILLEITGVRIERLQEISNDDALAEGINRPIDARYPVDEFRALWDSINEFRGFGWSVNPYVWVVEFRRIS